VSGWVRLVDKELVIVEEATRAIVKTRSRPSNPESIFIFEAWQEHQWVPAAQLTKSEWSAVSRVVAGCETLARTGSFSMADDDDLSTVLTGVVRARAALESHI
jgi:hypothetical protein